MKKVIFYVLSVLLVIGYVLVLLRGMDLKSATPEYRMFYVDQSTRFLMPDGQLEQYSENVLCTYIRGENFRNLGEGWNDIGEYGIWSEGNDASFYLDINDSNSDYVLELTISDSLGYNNALYVNGVFAGDIVFEDDVASINVSSELLNEGLNTFTIHTDDEVLRMVDIRPESENENHFNILLYSLILRSAS